MKLFDRQVLFDYLRHAGLAAWAEQLRELCDQRLSLNAHGSMPAWAKAWHELPEKGKLLFEPPTKSPVIVEGNWAEPAQLQQTLLSFHPWRKGPFQLFGLEIDTEWRSDLKWDRLSSVDFRGKTVLDIGCGNGYYGWKMLAAGAEFVLGCDPTLLYLMQFEVLRRYAPCPEQHFIVPATDVELPDRLDYFDLVLSMGVLYHRTSPIDHLQKLHSALKPDGQLILETLILDAGGGAEVLVPEDRYAKMRNVWFIPTIAMLERWLKRTGFRDLQLLDTTKTTPDEQRATDWMTYESLADFLNPADLSKTIEGYPAPVRAIMTARRAK